MRGKRATARQTAEPERKAATVSVMSVSSPAIRPFGKTIVAVFTSLIEDFLGAYHPERHYMRGPGPKWRQKHAVRSAAPRPALNADRDFAEAAA